MDQINENQDAWKTCLDAGIIKRYFQLYLDNYEDYGKNDNPTSVGFQIFNKTVALQVKYLDILIEQVPIARVLQPKIGIFDEHFAL